MGQPAAKQGDRITATDTHIVLVPSASGTTPVPMPFPFKGIINGNLSSDVLFDKQPAATKDSTAQNTPSHIPRGGSFQRPPTNQGRINSGSSTVFINGKPAARAGDQAFTCNDPQDQLIGVVVVGRSTILIG